MNTAIFQKLMAIRAKGGSSTLLPDGLVFYMPMESTITKATIEGVEGQKSYTYGRNISAVTFQTFKGVPCAYFPGDSLLHKCHVPACSNWTISVWAYCTLDTNSTRYQYLLSSGSNRHAVYWDDDDEYLKIKSYNASATGNTGKNMWRFCCISRDNTNAKTIYRIGDSVSTYAKGGTSSSDRIIADDLEIGTGTNGDWTINYGTVSATGYEFTGYMAGLRIYNRALSEEEMDALSKEFTPTE